MCQSILRRKALISMAETPSASRCSLRNVQAASTSLVVLPLAASPKAVGEAWSLDDDEAAWRTSMSCAFSSVAEVIALDETRRKGMRLSLCDDSSVRAESESRSCM